MSILPSHLFYTDTHLWVFIDAEGYATIGLTDFAQETLGDVVEVFLPPENAEFEQGLEMMSIAAERNHFQIHAPLSGEVVEVNTELEAMPRLINDEPYDAGWLVKMAPHDSAELDDLMSDEEYAGLIE
ncbi:MAG: glycine cleavage system protein GcvH [Hydrogenovibrio sp.]|nr:glycine cleavage system protein GcvH [Hydrogenovibrio sp.]